MLLSQPELRAAVEKGEIVFDPPLDEQQWGQASVDLRLGFGFTRLKKLSGVTVSVADGLNVLSELGFWETVSLKEKDAFGKRESFVIAPGEFVLAMTHEKIKVPNNLIALVEGRSTYARVGLSMHQTAPWIQPGWPGKSIVLEIYNTGPLNIQLTPVLDRVCQLSFMQISSELPAALAYGSKPTDAYGKQEHPIAVKGKTVTT
jgi:dCTP deaminase